MNLILYRTDVVVKAWYDRGLYGYFRDPEFDQNTVRDSGKTQNILTGIRI